jgi:hypothetical protein
MTAPNSGAEPACLSPAYLGRVLNGEAQNCEPQKTSQVRWFALADLPANLTMTARNAIDAYGRQQREPRCGAAG